MKYRIISLIAITLLCWTTSAQDCSQYYLMVEGATFQYTNYNKKGKMESTVDYRVKDVQDNGSGISATMVMVIKDKKGEASYESEYAIICEDGKVKIDFKSLMNQGMYQQFGDMDIDISGTDLELPNNLSVGQELPDANVDVSINSGAPMKMSMSVQTTNRKVEKEETVTTPAGSFDCVVISSEVMAKMMLGKQTIPSKEWISEGVGIVKQETYNKNGKLLGYMELTQFSK